MKPIQNIKTQHLQLGNKTEGVQFTPSNLTEKNGSKEMNKFDTRLKQYLQLGNETEGVLLVQTQPKNSREEVKL